MRLWSLHPKYLDPVGLVALWREALLAQAVLRGKTRGYRFHPQVARFKGQPHPVATIRSYLRGIHDEACTRGYAFDRRKLGRYRRVAPVAVSHGQIAYEWQHLLSKLAIRAPLLYEKWRAIRRPEPHPLFRLQRGGIAAWEHVEH